MPTNRFLQYEYEVEAILDRMADHESFKRLSYRRGIAVSYKQIGYEAVLEVLRR